MNAFYPNTPPTYRYQLSHVLGCADKFKNGLMVVLLQVTDHSPVFGTPAIKIETYHLCRDYETGVLSARLNASPDKIICYARHDDLHKDLLEFLPTFRKTVGEGSSTAKVSVYLASAMITQCSLFDELSVV